MKRHFYCNTKSYQEPIVKPYTKIERHNLTKIQADNQMTTDEVMEKASQSCRILEAVHRGDETSKHLSLDIILRPNQFTCF